jgi:hypothetical protein
MEARSSLKNDIAWGTDVRCSSDRLSDTLKFKSYCEKILIIEVSIKWAMGSFYVSHGFVITVWLQVIPDVWPEGLYGALHASGSWIPVVLSVQPCVCPKTLKNRLNASTPCRQRAKLIISHLLSSQPYSPTKTSTISQCTNYLFDQESSFLPAICTLVHSTRDLNHPLASLNPDTLVCGTSIKPG